VKLPKFLEILMFLFIFCFGATNLICAVKTDIVIFWKIHFGVSVYCFTVGAVYCIEKVFNRGDVNEIT